MSDPIFFCLVIYLIKAVCQILMDSAAGLRFNGFIFMCVCVEYEYNLLIILLL